MKTSQIYCIITCTYIAVLVGLIGIVMLAGFSAIFEAILHKLYQVTEGTEVQEIWVNTPVPIIMRVFFFNLTNYKEFLKGEHPKLEEVGPYVYREYHHKEDLYYHENYTVTYYQKRNWTWDEVASEGRKQDDIIVTLNPVPVSAAFTVQHNNKLLEGLNTMLNSLDEQAVVFKAASEILFDGYKDPLLTMMNNTETIHNLVPDNLAEYDRFGWFYKRNNSLTYDGIYNMYTGESSLDDVGKIDWWDYTRNTDYFGYPCNEVTGSAGELWSPGIERDMIKFYNSDLCMTAKLYYKEDIEDHYGNEGYRFWGSNLTFANSTYVPENKCFCIDGVCGPTGLLYAKTCRFGAPAYVSFPHFLNADPDLLNQVEGLNPDPERHSFFIDLNPDLGIPLQVAARIQINMQVQPYPGGTLNIGQIKILKSVPNVILPMLWFEDLSAITPSLSDEIQIALFFENSPIPTIVFSLMTASGVIVSSVLIFILFRRTRQAGSIY